MKFKTDKWVFIDNINEIRISIDEKSNQNRFLCVLGEHRNNHRYQNKYFLYT